MIRKKRLTANKAMRKVVNGRTTNKKKMELLSSIDQKLDNVESEYGPIVYTELQSRLEESIKLFNEDVNSLFSSSFSSYKPKAKSKEKEDSDKSKKPKYISVYEESKKDW